VVGIYFSFSMERDASGGGETYFTTCKEEESMPPPLLLPPKEIDRDHIEMMFSVEEEENVGDMIAEGGKCICVLPHFQAFSTSV